MRGDACRPQPLRSDAGDVLLWNGEIFGGGVAVGVGESDTERLLSALVQAAGAGGGDCALAKAPRFADVRAATAQHGPGVRAQIAAGQAAIAHAPEARVTCRQQR